MTYLLISGRPPFLGKDRAELFVAIVKAKPSFSEKPWSKVSAACKAFVSSCLEFNPSRRPSALELLKSEWIQRHEGPEAMSNEEEKEIVEELKKFSVRGGVMC